MKKLPRFEPGGIYHLFNHANGRENVFENRDNYFYFLKKYGEKLSEVVTTLAYCLMPNHFHLLVKIKPKVELFEFLERKKERKTNLYLPGGLTEVELPHFIVHRQFHNFLGGYSKAFNKYHDRKGSLLRQNTQRKIVNDQGYIMNVIRYLHLNPVYHGFTFLPEDWPYSSYLAFLSDAPTKIPREGLLKWFGGLDAFIQFHRAKMDGDLDSEMEK